MWFHRKVCWRNSCILWFLKDNLWCVDTRPGLAKEISTAPWRSVELQYPSRTCPWSPGAGWSPFVFQVVLNTSTTVSGCLSSPPCKSQKPAACYALSHPFTVQTPLSTTLYKKKLVFSEQKLLLLFGWDFPDLWVILIKPRNVLKAVALETTNYFIVEA